MGYGHLKAVFGYGLLSWLLAGMADLSHLGGRANTLIIKGFLS